MSTSSRSKGYTDAEDQHLCHVYLDISQNPIVGINQSRDQFWTRIEESYNTNMPVGVTEQRSNRSLRTRMSIILQAVGKLRGCINQIEYTKPSGWSELDIYNRAKEMVRDMVRGDKNFPKGFNFDNVWQILKDTEKFTTCKNTRPPSQKRQSDSSQSDCPDANSPIPDSPGLSSFNINLSDDNVGGTSTERPIGVKRAKLKKKADDNLAAVLKTIKEENEKLRESLRNDDAQLAQNYELQMVRARAEEKKQENMQRKIALQERKEEDKILYMNVDAITDPQLRELTRARQRKIMEKRSQELQTDDSWNSSLGFSQYFKDIGGSGSGLPDY